MAELNEAAARELFDAGLNDAAIAEELGVSVGKIKDWRYANRLVRRGGRPSGEPGKRKNGKPDAARKRGKKQTAKAAAGADPDVEAEPERLTVESLLSILRGVSELQPDARVAVGDKGVGGAVVVVRYDGAGAQAEVELRLETCDA